MRMTQTYQENLRMTAVPTMQAMEVPTPVH
jgi:hypothetical protein